VGAREVEMSGTGKEPEDDPEEGKEKPAEQEDAARARMSLPAVAPPKNKKKKKKKKKKTKTKLAAKGDDGTGDGTPPPAAAGDAGQDDAPGATESGVAAASATHRDERLGRVCIDNEHTWTEPRAGAAALADCDNEDENHQDVDRKKEDAGAWSAYVDKTSGDTYFANNLNGRVTWTEPKAGAAPGSDNEGEKHQDLEEKKEKEDAGAWSAYVDKTSGDTYFANDLNGRVTWTDPKAGTAPLRTLTTSAVGIELVENPVCRCTVAVALQAVQQDGDNSPTAKHLRHRCCKNAAARCQGPCRAFAVFTAFTMISFATLTGTKLWVVPSYVSSPWMDVSYGQTAFYLAVVASCANVATMASVPPSSWWRRCGYYHASATAGNVILSACFFVLLVYDVQWPAKHRVFMRMQPAVYQDVGRGNCTRLENLFQGQKPSLKVVCPKFAGRVSQRSFVTVHPEFANVDMVEQLSKIQTLLDLFVNVFHSHSSNYPFYQTCNTLFMEMLCNVSLPFCRYQDCRRTRDDMCTYAHSMNNSRISDRNITDLTECIHGNTTRNIEPYFKNIFYRTTAPEGFYVDWVKREPHYLKMIDWMTDKMVNLVQIPKKCAVLEGENGDDKDGDTKDDKHDNDDFRISCDPDAVPFNPMSDPDAASNYIYDMSSFWIAVMSSFSLFVFALGNIGRGGHSNSVVTERRHYLRFDGVRLATASIGVFMSLLVFIGGLHLQSVGVSVWGEIYLFSAWLCLHGGLTVLTLERSKEIALRKRSHPSRRSNEPTDQEMQEVTWCLSSFVRVFELKCACCVKTVRALRRVKAEFWDAGGVYFPVKLVLLEVVEVGVQMSSLITTASTSDAGHVYASAIAIAANLVVLAAATLAAHRVFDSATAMLAAILVVEVTFDKIFVAITLFLRFDTLTNPNLGAVTHLGVLFPAMLTFLDVKDALDLSDHVESTLRQRRRGAGLRLSGIKRVRKMQQQQRKTRCDGGSCFTATVCQTLFQVIMCACGLFLGIYTVVVFQHRLHGCRQVLGPIAVCARPRLYFRNGFFGPTTCAWENVTSLNCTDVLLAETEREAMVRLPNAVLAYSSMVDLSTIDISHSHRLKRMPIGWVHIPNTTLRIAAEDCPRLAHVPYQLCRRNSSLHSLSLGAKTLAGHTLDWSAQLAATGDDVHFNAACEAEWSTSLKTLLLSNNTLSCWKGLYKEQMSFHTPNWEAKWCTFDDVSKLSGLLNLDLRGNNISRITVHMANILKPISLRGNVRLEGNPLRSLTLGAVGAELTTKWLHTIKSVNSKLETLNLRACSLGPESAEVLNDILIGSSVRELTLDANLLGDTGMRNLIPGLIAANRTLVEVNIDGIFLRASGLHVLLNAAIEHKLKWTHLNIGLNNYSNVSTGREIQKFLGANPQLEILNVRSGKMSAIHIQDFAKSAQNLRSLDLQGNYLENDVYEAFAEMLPGSNMEILKFGVDIIQSGNIERGVRALMRVLNQTKLERLDLSLDNETWKISTALFDNNVTNALGKRILINCADSLAGYIGEERRYFDERYAGGGVPPTRCVCDGPTGRRIEAVSKCNSCVNE
jgi:hypothetical protein